ncbi:hypothetical protein T35B1_00700 [Salinisphaera shabanensis T35B1]|uniref:hypothetical protein n=1 Tax=Salinisphaera shabanensis TaxID=180542 RepID=UPI003341EBA0
MGPGENDRFDFNLGAPAVLILASSAVEAFVNEASSIAHSLRFMAEKNGRFDTHADRIDSAELDFSLSELDQIASIRECGRGSFTERYKRLLRFLRLSLPRQWNDLCLLRKLRDALVHFRACDIPVINGDDGIIRHGQEVPTLLEPLKSIHVNGFPILARGAQTEGEDWTLRIATNAMAVWALNTVLSSLAFSVENIGEGWYGQKLKSHCEGRDKRYASLFDMGLQEVANWRAHIQNGAEFQSHFGLPGS